MVRGRLQSREYTNDDGLTRKVTEIVVAGRDGMINLLTPGRAGEDDPAPEPADAALETPHDIPF